MKKLTLWVLPLFLFLSCYNENLQEKYVDEDGLPFLTGNVINDFTEVALDSTNKKDLDQRLVEYSKDTAVPRIIVMVIAEPPQRQSGGQWTQDEFGFAVLKKWQMQKNTVLLLVFTRNHKESLIITPDLQSTFTSADLQLIFNKDIRDYYLNGEYYKAINYSVNNIIQVITSDKSKNNEGEGGTKKITLLSGLALLIIFGIIFCPSKSKKLLYERMSQ